LKHDKDKLTGEYANKYPPTFKAKIPYNSFENKFEFDCYDMENNETNFNDILANLKGGKAQFIIQLSGIWFSAGMFGCSWKIVSAKFQQINTSKITFVADSDDDNANDDEDDEDDISVDTDVIAKISQKPVAAAAPAADKKTVVEKVVVPVAAAAAAAAKTVHKPIPQEEEDDEEEDEEDDVEADDAGLANVEEEDEDDEEDEPEPPPVKVEEPVKPEAKTKKAVVKKK
jgi:hypothetical protein